jgi:hypothetical protein
VQIGEGLIEENVMKLQKLPCSGIKFERRITSICWHPKYPYIHAAGSKFGDITVGSVDRIMSDSSNSGWIPKKRFEMKGGGAGGSITAMQFDDKDMNILYRTSIDSTVKRLNLADKNSSLTYFDFNNYQ